MDFCFGGSFDFRTDDPYRLRAAARTGICRLKIGGHWCGGRTMHVDPAYSLIHRQTHGDVDVYAVLSL